MSNKKKKLFRIRIKPQHPELDFEVSTFVVIATNQESAEARVIKTMLGAMEMKGIKAGGYKITLCKEIQFDHITEAD